MVAGTAVAKQKHIYNTWVNVTCRDGGRDVTMATWLWCAGGDILFSKYNGRPFPANVDGIPQLMRQLYLNDAYNRTLSSWAVDSWTIRAANDIGLPLLLCLWLSRYMYVVAILNLYHTLNFAQWTHHEFGRDDNNQKEGGCEISALIAYR